MTCLIVLTFILQYCILPILQYPSYNIFRFSFPHSCYSFLPTNRPALNMKLLLFLLAIFQFGPVFLVTIFSVWSSIFDHYFFSLVLDFWSLFFRLLSFFLFFLSFVSSHPNYFLFYSYLHTVSLLSCNPD